MKSNGESKNGSRQANGGHLRAWLEQQIADGQLRPGDRLDERDLCQRFKVSRTPVREAFLQLASIGLITFLPRQGAVVARMTVKEIISMWEVLTGLESLCAELAARRIPPELLANLVEVHEESKAALAAGNVIAYDEANKKLHGLIYAGSQNDYLARKVVDIRRRLGVYRRLPFERPGGMERSLQGHDKVVQAIIAGDDKAAHAAMREHVSGGLTFLDFVAQLNATVDVASEAGVMPEQAPTVSPASLVRPVRRTAAKQPAAR